ncbi:MAG: hypothetical protein JJ896_02280 [Rhodothermales bacterium]|nr:hypothetical protein [Rhodothermales bacterium]MBO6778457.1 hypothetical protein [Rhodothermales bacterium]
MSRLLRIKEHLKALNPVAIVVELLIVFVGVYLAFALTEARENRLMEERRQVVLELLREGLVRFESAFEGYAQFHGTTNPQVLAQLRSGEVPYFGDQLYVAPQYPIETIDYVLTDESFDVLDLEVYVPLSQYANRFRQVMYVEESLTRIAEQYVPASAGDPHYARQMQLAQRYYRLLESRRTISANIAELSRQLLEVLPESR